MFIKHSGKNSTPALGNNSIYNYKIKNILSHYRDVFIYADASSSLEKSNLRKEANNLYQSWRTSTLQRTLCTILYIRSNDNKIQTNL